MAEAITLERLASLNAAYIRSIDDGPLEDWPNLFFPSCHYRVTTADNHRDGMQAGLIYTDSQGMLVDRVTSLRKANVYERQTYRHIIGAPAIIERAADAVVCESSFLVVRIMRDGKMDVFATGRYLDRVSEAPDGRLCFTERVVVLDSSNIDTMLAIPL